MVYMTKEDLKVIVEAIKSPQFYHSLKYNQIFRDSFRSGNPQYLGYLSILESTSILLLTLSCYSNVSSGGNLEMLQRRKKEWM